MEWGDDKSWGNGVYCYSVWAKFFGETFRKAIHSRLCCGVNSRESSSAIVGGEGAYVNDSSVIVFEHVWDSGAATVEHASQVQIHRSVPDGIVHFGYWDTFDHAARVVD